MRNHIRAMALLMLAGATLRVDATINGSLATSANTNFSETQFVPGTATTNPTFFVGAFKFGNLATNTEKTFALARAKQTADNNGVASVSLTPLAPQATSVLNSLAADDSKLFGKKITDMQLLNGFPVVTLDGDANVYYVMSNDGNLVLTNDDGSTVQQTINDAGGAATKEVRAIAAGDGNIFAAVSATNVTWNDDTIAGANRGIAVLRPNLALQSLSVLNSSSFTGGGSSAKKLDLAALTDATQTNPVAFFGATPLANVTGQIARATLGADVEMFYHPGMQRVYVGLTDAGRDNFNLEGGVFGLFMARIDTTGNGSLVLQPVISGVKRNILYNDGPSAPTSQQNVINRVIGFYADGKNGPGARDNAVTVKQIRAMTTHTGKNYLIVNSEVGVGQNVDRGVFALPLIDSTDEALKGTISAVNGSVPTFNSAPTSFATMLNSSLSGVRVSSPDARLLTDIFVSGDTVYMSSSGNMNEKAGIFASTALFDKDGNIRGWTPAQRVLGSVQDVVGCGFDAPRGNCYALTNATDQAIGGDINTVRISQWGKTTSNLSDVLEQLFPAEQGGLVSLNVFNAEVPGLDDLSGFSMMVAVGPQKIAIIQNGTTNLNGAIPVTTFITEGTGQNVFVIDTNQSPALAAIAPLTCAEIARSAAADSGWLFVGGYNGVAVLSNNTPATNDLAADSANSPAGRGWASDMGLSGLPSGLNADAFPLGANWTFKELMSVGRNPFFNVHKLSAANGRMYVVTVDGMFFFDMNATKFVADTTNPAETPVNTLKEKRIGGFDDELISDLVVLAPDTAANNNCGVVATDQGVFASNLMEVGNSMEMQVAQTNDLTLRLFALPDVPGKAPKTANIVALGTDFENNNDKLFLFDVPDSTQIPEFLIQVPANNVLLPLKETRFDAAVDGDMILATLPQHRNETDFVSLYNLGSSVSRNLAPDMGISEKLSARTFVRNIVHDNASGAVMVAGDWGVRVNN